MFVGCREVVAGYKQNKLNTLEENDLTPSPEANNVNCWVKKVKTLSKDCKFAHPHEKLILCVTI